MAPSVQERALDDTGEAIRFVERLESDEFDLAICMTGAGLSFLDGYFRQMSCLFKERPAAWLSANSTRLYSHPQSSSTIS